MAEVVEFPLDDGNVLRVQAATADAAGSGLGLASPGDRIAQAGEKLDNAIAEVTPALKTVTEKLRALSPDDLTVEFGLTLTAESGVVVAKGSAEVHFTVTLGWQRSGEFGRADGGRADGGHRARDEADA